MTLLPEKTVLAILEDRRAPRRAAQFRETAARRSFVAAERLARQGAFADALPLALDAVRRAQDIHETPRARRMAAEAAEREARARRASSSGSPSGAKRNPRETSVTNTGGTSAPHVALFEPYLLAASIALALGKTEACDSLLGLASWIALRRGDAVSETQRARLKRLRGELRSRQGRTRDALEEFASAAVHAAEASGPQTPRVALELFKLADAFRETPRRTSAPTVTRLAAKRARRRNRNRNRRRREHGGVTAREPDDNRERAFSVPLRRGGDANMARRRRRRARTSRGILRRRRRDRRVRVAFETDLLASVARLVRGPREWTAGGGLAGAGARRREGGGGHWRRRARFGGDGVAGARLGSLRRARTKRRASWTRRTRRTKRRTKTKANPPTRRSRRRSRRLSRASRRRSRRSRRRRTARRSRERRWRGGAAPRVDARRSDRRRDSRRDPREEEGCGST